MAAIALNQQLFEPHMKGPLAWSVMFHMGLVLLAVVGLPYMKPELPIVDTSIAVELVDAEEAEEIKPEPERPREQPKQIKDKPPKPVAPQMVAKKPPKPVAPSPPEQDDFAEPEKDTPEPIAKPEPKTVKAPAEVKRKPVMTRDNNEEQEDFKSLLRNLMPTEEEAAQADKNRTGEQSMLTRSARSMNTGELQALKAQLNGCWSVLAGARYAEDLVVELKLFVNPDRSIRDVQIVDQLRYSGDKFFRAAADAAQRAVFRCSPLDLPPEKYELWDVITVTFDPRKML